MSVDYVVRTLSDCGSDVRRTHDYQWKKGRLRILVLLDHPVMSHCELSVSNCSDFNKSSVRLPEMGPGCLVINEKKPLNPIMNLKLMYRGGTRGKSEPSEFQS